MQTARSTSLRESRLRGGDWLLGHLADEKRAGSAGAGEVLRAARADGFNERLLQRARKRAQVSTHRTATGWTWTLDTPRRQGDNLMRT
jgi:hypothetical protein